MLKFIRKYQLFILAIGGSLLMVVFLLQPILRRLSPSPLKAKVATLEDGSNFRRSDIHNANFAISLLKRVNPRALMARSAGGMGLDDSSESNTALHWLMLVKQARAAGLVGEAGDGAAWIDELARQEAYFQTINESRQGLIQSEAQAEQRLTELQGQIKNIMHRNATLTAGNAGGTIDDVYRILAQARGVYRLLSAIDSMPAYSDVRAMEAAHDTLDSVAVNATVLDSSLLATAIPDPSDEQLNAFFDTYRAQSPADNEYKIGYTQPTRIQLGWLTLDKNVFMNTVEVDRIELNKIWRKHRDQYPGDFAAERMNLERQYRQEQAIDMIAEADRVIRAQVLAKTNGLPKVNGELKLPDDWETQRPRLAKIADTVVERINEQFSVSLPTPAVTLEGDRWFNANAIVRLPGFGTSSYRVGSRQLPAYTLTQFFELEGPNTTGLDVQQGLPLVDPASEDQLGNRYYAVVLGVKGAGEADSITDVTREQVVKDYKAVEAYKLLTARMDELGAAIKENGSLDRAIDLAMTLAPDQASVTRPAIQKNILVRRDSIDPPKARVPVTVNPKLNAEPFRDAVLSTRADLDPLGTPEQVAQDPIPVVVALPGSKAVALAIVVAPRPVTLDRFRAVARGVIQTTAQHELVDAGLAEEDPFTFAALSKRYGLTRLKDDDKANPSDEDRDGDQREEG